MSLSAKMIDRRTCTPRGNHSYGPFFLEYSLLAEYNLLRKQKLPGVYVIPSTHTPLCKYKKKPCDQILLGQNGDQNLFENDYYVLIRNKTL